MNRRRHQDYCAIVLAQLARRVTRPFLVLALTVQLRQSYICYCLLSIHIHKHNLPDSVLGKSHLNRFGLRCIMSFCP